MKALLAMGKSFAEKQKPGDHGRSINESNVDMYVQPEVNVMACLLQTKHRHDSQKNAHMIDNC